MHPEIQELVELLESAYELLAKHGEKRWSSWLAKDAQLIRNIDLYGIEHLLSAFGGMGSINDLVIHPMNGHKIQEYELNAVNEKLGLMLSKISILAKKLYSEEAQAHRKG